MFKKSGINMFEIRFRMRSENMKATFALQLEIILKNTLLQVMSDSYFKAWITNSFFTFLSRELKMLYTV